MEKQMKLSGNPSTTTVRTARFNEISKQIKISIELLTQLCNPFDYSEPIPVDTHSVNNNSNLLVNSNFVFREPLERLNSEENDTAEELVELLSLLNIGNGGESPNQLDSSVHPFEEVVLSSESIQTFNDSMKDEKEKDEVDDYPIDPISTACNDNIETSSIQLNGCMKEEEKVDNIQVSTIHSSMNEEIAVTLHHPYCSIQSSSFQAEPGDGTEEHSSTKPDYQNNEYLSHQNEIIQNNEATTDGNRDIETYSPDCSMEENGQNIGTSNHQNDFISFSGHSKQKNVENIVTSTDGNEENIQTVSIQLDSLNEPDFQNNVAMDLENYCSAEQNGGTNKATQVDNDNPTSSLQPDCLNIGTLCMIQSPAIGTDCSKQQDVGKNVTSTDDDNDNNYSQPTATRYVDIDPNTQITHLDVDNNRNGPPPRRYHDSQPLPFLIKHIHTITWPNQEELCWVPTMNLFGQTFSTVMVYGVVTSVNVENGGLFQRFVIDDGSGAVNVVWKADNRILELVKTVRNLDDEIKKCRQSNTEQCTDMLDSFNQIIHFVKREVTRRTKLKLFGHVAVVGRPIRPPGKGIVQLHATHVQEDSGQDRSLELYFKKNLIRLYEEKYMKID